jgi:hypothetical protein
MTISTTSSKIAYSGNDATTDFSFPYKIFTNSDIVVILTSVLGVDTTLTLTTDYTIVGAGLDAGGTVTMITPPATGEELIIYREVAVTQTTDYISGDAFPAETHETALDRLTMIAQQQDENIRRSLKFSPSSTTYDAYLPDPVDGKILYWDTGVLVNTTDSVTDILSGLTAAQIAAEAAQTAAEAAQSGAELVLSSFDSKYLGEKSSDPILDNGGQPLQIGAEYFNTVALERRVWTGSAWIVSGASTASGIINIPNGDIASTDVQSAINELDNKKISSTDVQSAINELDNKKISKTAVKQVTGTSTTDFMSQNAVTESLKPPSVIASATFTKLTNNILLNGIVASLSLEAGDVIQITGSASNNRLHTIETITDANNVIVNEAHKNGAGSLSLVDETATVTIKRIAKWYNAPLGEGQAWQDLTASRSAGVTYTNTTGRAIFISIRPSAAVGTTIIVVDGVDVAYAAYTTAISSNFSVVVPDGSTYRMNGPSGIMQWAELR